MKTALLSAFCALLVLGVIQSGCRHSTGPSDDTTRHHDTTVVHDTTHHDSTSHDSGVVNPKAGSYYGYREFFRGYDGSDSLVSDWQDYVASSGIAAYGRSNTYTFIYPPAFGGSQQRVLLANGDLMTYCPTPPTGGPPAGAQTPLNQWVTWPMYGSLGMHQVLLNNSNGIHKVITMNILDHVTLQTAAGPQMTVHYIEKDSVMYPNGSGDLGWFEQWYCPALGVHVKTVNLYNPYAIKDTLVSVRLP